MAVTEALVFVADLSHVGGLQVRVDEVAHHWHGAAGIQNVNDGLRISLRKLDGGVRFAGCGATDEERLAHAQAFHFAGDVGHFIERWSD